MKYSAGPVQKVVRIDEGNTNKEIALSKSDIILVLLQVAMMLGFKKKCF